jgi:hypothetical protein
VIDIQAVPDCADAIDNLSGLIEFKRHLGQVVEIAVWMGAHHKRNLWFGEPDLSCRFHRACSFALTPLSRAAPVRDLLLCAKHLFAAARKLGALGCRDAVGRDRLGFQPAWQSLESAGDGFFGRRAGFVTLRQAFVRGCHGGNRLPRAQG